MKMCFLWLEIQGLESGLVISSSGEGFAFMSWGPRITLPKP